MKKFYENDLEEIIYTADREVLEDRGLFIPNGRLFRQLRIGNYGIADLVSVSKSKTPDGDAYIDIEVIELKEDKIGLSAFLQAIKYVKGIHSYLSDNRLFDRYKLGMCLIGSSMDVSGTFCYLPDLIGDSNVFSPYNNGNIDLFRVYTYEYKIDGIYFQDQRGFKLDDEGF